MPKTQHEPKGVPEAHVTKEDIKAGLHALGLGHGDCVGVHSSLSSFGFVGGGADAVIDALLETVGSDGTVVMPAYSTNRQALELTPREKQLGVLYKFKVLPFDPERAPAWTGGISDAFWRRAEARRGSHPSFSLAAIGAKADKLCEGWRALLEENGYILLLGVTLGCCSAMHLVEEDTQLPEHTPRRLTPPPELVQQAESGDIDYDMRPYPDFEAMDAPCCRQGIMKVTTVGKAEVKLVRLRELIDLYRSCLQEDPGRFYHD